MIDLTGRSFGRLSVLGLAERSPAGKVRWRCSCECGGSATVMTDALKSGKTQSCGCLQKERTADALRKHGDGSRAHGEAREYRSWMGMLTRCHNPRNPKYPRYGGRGISVCDKWRASYATFLADMGRCPPGFSLDRIDVDGDYEPGNCRWADAATQAFNRRQRPRKRALPVGVVPKKYNRYQAVIGVRGEHVNLGSFGSVAEAAAARQQAELALYGQHSPQ